MATGTGSDAPTVVLVHGAFADATGWSHVIIELEKMRFFQIAFFISARGNANTQRLARKQYAEVPARAEDPAAPVKLFARSCQFVRRFWR